MLKNKLKGNEITILSVLLLALLVCLSLTWNVYQARQQTLTLAETEAKVNLQRDLALRQWATGHGGVYIRVTESSQPNPYLSNMKDRDVKTPSGDMLTLYSPATMIREIMEKQNKFYGTLTRITALRLLNPSNAPDDWEKKALLIIQATKQDYSEITEIEGKPYLRRMQPMLMEEGCMKCHAWTGLKVGEIRGATDYSVALAPYYDLLHDAELKLFFSHFGILFIGIGIIFYISRKNKQSKSEIKKILVGFEQSPTSIVISDVASNIQYVNRRFTEVTGYTMKEVLGKNPRILNSGLTPNENFLAMWDRLTKGQDWSGEFINKKKNGEIYYEEAYISPAKDVDGNITNYIAVKLDITERKKMEYALLKSREQSEAANKAKSEFLAKMSHELRTPIHGIMGFNQLLIDNNPREDQVANLKYTIESSVHLLDIVNNILGIAEFENLTDVFADSVFSLKDLIYEIQNSFQNIITSKNLEWKCSFALDLIDWIRSDRDRLSQILNNLLSNAIKFTEQGSIEINFESEKVSGDTHKLTITVVDTGKGIAEDYQERIFDIFSQEDNSISRKYGGTGMGLAICKKFTQSLGGDIWVESKLDHGSKFTFTILCEAVARVDDSSSTKENSSIPSSIKILVVEDDEINRLIMVKILKSFGYHALTVAEDGIQALQKIEKEPFDLVLTDLHMPNMNGMELVEKIMQLPSRERIAVVAVTADANAQTKKKCLELGMIGFITKPFNKTQIQELIKSKLNKN